MCEHFILFFNCFVAFTWNRLRLHTCVFSYLPKVTDVMMVWASSCSVMYWGGLLPSEDQRDDWSDGLF